MNNLRSKLKELYLAFNSPPDFGRNFKDYSATYQAEKIQEARADRVNNAKAGLNTLRDRIAKEKKEVASSIAKIKYPLASSSLDKVAGELQINTAAMFLFSKPSPGGILAAIENALNQGRTDYAFAVVDQAQAAFTGDINGNLKPDERRLNEALRAAVAEFPGYPEIKRLESELEELPGLEGAAQSFTAQIEGGQSKVIVPILWKDLSDSQRNQMNCDISLLPTTVEMVHFRNKIHAAQMA